METAQAQQQRAAAESVRQAALCAGLQVELEAARREASAEAAAGRMLVVEMRQQLAVADAVSASLAVRPAGLGGAANGSSGGTVLASPWGPLALGGKAKQEAEAQLGD